MRTAKAIAAMVSLIIATLLSSNLIPLSGPVHLILGILSIVAGTVATYAIPNAQPLKPARLIDLNQPLATPGDENK